MLEAGLFGRENHVTDFGGFGRIWWLYGEVDGVSVLSAGVVGSRRSPGATNSGASIACSRWISVLVSLSRSSSASICVSFTETWPRKKSFSFSRRTTYRSSGLRTDANVRVRSRLVATIRDCSHLLDVGDVAIYGVRRDEVFFAGLGLDLVAIEL